MTAPNETLTAAITDEYGPVDREADAIHVGRSQLHALVSGVPVLLGDVDLVALANVAYEPPDPTIDPDEVSAAMYGLDHFWYGASETRQFGGARAQDMHYSKCRYEIPFLLELRGDDGPLKAAELRTSDITTYVQMLAGERSLPAATAAAATLNRLAITCHWLSAEDAARASGLTREEFAAHLHTLPIQLTADGQPVVRAMDLRRAGLLVEPHGPHGLSLQTATNILQLIQGTWELAEVHGATMRGRPRAIRAKRPLPGNRKTELKAAPRTYVPIDRCLEIAALLHPIHQMALWTARLLAARDSEAFGWLVGDRDGNRLHLAAIGGANRWMRIEDGTFTRTERRPGTKGSVEGVVAPGHEGESRDLQHRTVPIPPSLVAFYDAIDRVFHTDPHTGARETGARAIPGLRHDDAGGLASFGDALRRACEELAAAGGPPGHITPHDLRASLNTDLENAGIDDRLLRHFLGHRSENSKSLDTHDAHYDLGLDDNALDRLAEAIEALLPEDVNLCVPTGRMPSFGKDTRYVAGRSLIQQQLLDLGWYVPAPADRGESGQKGHELPIALAAEQLGLSVSEVKRRIARGDLPARRSRQGHRTMWLIPQEAVEQERLARQGRRLRDLAQELAIPYERAWRIAHALGLSVGHRKGEAIRLNEEQAAILRSEIERQAAEAHTSMTHSEAAQHLGLTEPLIQTLVRSGDLDGEPSTRHISRVTRSSVERYAQAYPPCWVTPEETVVAIADVREVLGLSRPAVTDLVRTRRLAVMEINRRQYVGTRSLLKYLEEHPSEGALARLAIHEVSER